MCDLKLSHNWSYRIHNRPTHTPNTHTYKQHTYIHTHDCTYTYMISYIHTCIHTYMKYIFTYMYLITHVHRSYVHSLGRARNALCNILLLVMKYGHALTASNKPLFAAIAFFICCFLIILPEIVLSCCPLKTSLVPIYHHNEVALTFSSLRVTDNGVTTAIHLENCALYRSRMLDVLLFVTTRVSP